jgi:hypothetical protein
MESKNDFLATLADGVVTIGCSLRNVSSSSQNLFEVAPCKNEEGVLY